MGKKKKDIPKPPSAPGWMVTYGDLMSLLLVFFVLIVSFSEIELKKFKAAIGSMRGALQPWNPSPGGKNVMESIYLQSSKSTNMENIADEVVEVFSEEGVAALVEVQHSGGGLHIILSDPVLFESGEDFIKPNMKPILEKLVMTAKRMDAFEILVEGHTDDNPIQSQRFPSNWELSASRALQVIKIFQAGGYPPERLVAIGYSQYRPREKLPESASVGEKSINRRVEIYLNVFDEKEKSSNWLKQQIQSPGWGD